MKNTSHGCKYATGNLVRVRSVNNVSKTLDPLNSLDGCLFMKQMWDYCGKTFTIIKVVIHIFDEFQCKMYKTKIPLYLLDTVICNGLVDSFTHRCDRSCYFFWHEEWIEDAKK